MGNKETSELFNGLYSQIIGFDNSNFYLSRMYALAGKGYGVLRGAMPQGSYLTSSDFDIPENYLNSIRTDNKFVNSLMSLSFKGIDVCIARNMHKDSDQAARFSSVIGIGNEFKYQTGLFEEGNLQEVLDDWYTFREAASNINFIRNLDIDAVKNCASSMDAATIAIEKVNDGDLNSDYLQIWADRLVNSFEFFKEYSKYSPRKFVWSIEKKYEKAIKLVDALYEFA